jgi:hypothetical protein
MNGRLQPKAQVSLTAVIVGGQFMTPCPPKARCQPQVAYLILADTRDSRKATVMLQGADTKLQVSDSGGKDIIGRRYRFSGTIIEAKGQHEALAESQGFKPSFALAYSWHSTARR